MKRVLLVSLVLGCVVLLSLYGCTKEESSGVNKDAKQAIENGLKQLHEYSNTYLVATTHEAPDGVLNYIEIQSDGESYTEYPLDSDGNIGTVSFGASNDTQYVLYDWLTEDNKYYSVSSDKNNDIVYYSLPDAYGKSIVERKDMYISYMLKHFTSIEEYDSKSANIGNGDESFKVYKCTLPAENVRYILGLNSYSLYDSIEKDTSDDNIKKLCGYYKNELDMSLTFSDANVLVGITDEGMLKYVSIEVGGLGSRMYVTKCVITDDNISKRTKPDLSSAVKFETTLKETADYVSTFDSYDDAMKAMNNEETGGTSEESNTDSDEDAVSSEENNMDLNEDSVSSEENSTGSEDSSTEEITESDISEE